MTRTAITRATLAIGLLAAAVATAGAANAQHYNYGHRAAETIVDVRQDNQRYRIGAGIRNGNLTGAELRHIADQQRAIAAFERRARADGYLDRRERAILSQMQNNASRSISRLSNNGHSRYQRTSRFSSYDRAWYRRFWWR